MPQIKVFLDEKAQQMISKDSFQYLAERLTIAVETAFGIQGENDVAFDVFHIVYARNEAPVQIEVAYTAGADEYARGQSFDPGESEQKEAIVLIVTAFYEFLRKERLPEIKPSVWILPHYRSQFAPGVIG